MIINEEIGCSKKNMADLADVLVVEMVPLEIVAMMPAEDVGSVDPATWYRALHPNLPTSQLHPQLIVLH